MEIKLNNVSLAYNPVQGKQAELGDIRQRAPDIITHLKEQAAGEREKAAVAGSPWAQQVFTDSAVEKERKVKALEKFLVSASSISLKDITYYRALISDLNRNNDVATIRRRAFDIISQLQWDGNVYHPKEWGYHIVAIQRIDQLQSFVETNRESFTDEDIAFYKEVLKDIDRKASKANK